MHRKVVVMATDTMRFRGSSHDIVTLNRTLLTAHPDATFAMVACWGLDLVQAAHLRNFRLEKEHNLKKRSANNNADKTNTIPVSPGDKKFR